MVQAYKSIINKGLIEYSVVRNKLDSPGHFRVEYRIYCFCDKQALLHEFTVAVKVYLNCLVERTEQEGDHGYLYLIPVRQDESVREMIRS